MFHRFNDGREWLDDNRNTNIVLVAIGTLRTVFTALYDALLAALQAATWIGLTGHRRGARPLRRRLAARASS